MDVPSANPGTDSILDIGALNTVPGIIHELVVTRLHTAKDGPESVGSELPVGAWIRMPLTNTTSCPCLGSGRATG